VAACYASDLSRARNTAQAVADVHGHTVHTDPGLRERCFGQFEGHTWTEIEAQWPEASQAWRQRVPDWEPQGGESLLALSARVLNSLNRIAERHLGEQILVVVHGGVLDAFYRAATGLDLQAPRAWELRNTAINRLLWSPEGLSLVGWADTAHLDTNTLDERSV
jgi:probable phosphoglycerate mutase